VVRALRSLQQAAAAVLAQSVVMVRQLTAAQAAQVSHPALLGHQSPTLAAVAAVILLAQVVAERVAQAAAEPAVKPTSAKQLELPTPAVAVAVLAQAQRTAQQAVRV
jgi:hypothetical protein